jgi:hypothetical protein
MSFVSTILGLSTTFVASCIFVAMVLEAVKRRRIKVEPTSPPIVFHERPYAFVNLCLLYATLATLCMCAFLQIALLV